MQTSQNLLVLCISNVFRLIYELINFRKVQENALIRAVLKDKLYKEDFCGSEYLKKFNIMHIF